MFGLYHQAIIRSQVNKELEEARHCNS